jgi:hypothetical protein
MLLVDNIDNYKPVEWITREISSLHTLITVCGSILFLFNFIDENIWSYFLTISFYFCAQDLLLISIHYNTFKKFYNETLIHHLIFMYVVYNFKLFPKTLAFGLLSESSTYFLNKTWMMYQLKDQDKNIIKSNKFKYNCIILMILFFLFRVINFSIIFLYYLKIPNIFIYKNMLFIIVILNYYWFYKLYLKFISI